MKALPKGQYIRHFQYGLGVITESNEQRTDPAEGTPPKRSRAKRSKKLVTALLPAATAGAQ